MRQIVVYILNTYDFHLIIMQQKSLNNRTFPLTCIFCCLKGKICKTLTLPISILELRWTIHHILKMVQCQIVNLKWTYIYSVKSGISFRKGYYIYNLINVSSLNLMVRKFLSSIFFSNFCITL